MRVKVQVVRSPRRRKTVEAVKDGNKIVVRLPATLTRSEARRWVREMLYRIEESEHVRRLNEKRDLQRRAEELGDDERHPGSAGSGTPASANPFARSAHASQRPHGTASPR